MSKKTAFTLAPELPRKMVKQGVFSYINVLPAAGNFWVEIGSILKFCGKNFMRVSRHTASYQPNMASKQRLPDARKGRLRREDDSDSASIVSDTSCRRYQRHYMKNDTISTAPVHFCTKKLGLLFFLNPLTLYFYTPFFIQ